MLVVTGFGPFLKFAVNPSSVLGKKVQEHFGEQECIFLELPVTFSQSFDVLRQNIEQNHPKALILLGLAAERSKICLERVALNWMESKRPDNLGEIANPPRKIIESAPEAYILNNSNIFLKAFTDDSQLEISCFAGTYVCNHLYFLTLHHYPVLRASTIFIHVPLFEAIEEKIQINLLIKTIESALALNKPTR